MTTTGHDDRSARSTRSAFWREACDALGIDPACEWDHFSFGGTPALATELAGLVVEGNKRATAGLVAEEQLDGNSPPAEGGLWVVTDGHAMPVALIESQQVRIAPFASVDASFAWDEGEGDRSLRWWRDAHVAYFKGTSCPRAGVDWSEQLEIAFERFEVRYPMSSARRRIARTPASEREWADVHRLRERALFARCHPDVRYDPSHPDYARSDVFALGLFSERELLATAQVVLRPRERSRLQLVAVGSSQQRQGLGRELVDAALAFARVNGSTGVFVFCERAAAGFYRALGFVDAEPLGEQAPGTDVVPLAVRL